MIGILGLRFARVKYFFEIQFIWLMYKIISLTNNELLLESIIGSICQSNYLRKVAKIIPPVLSR